MRSETYMVVDPRRDHSFRVPRPDLSSELASPNACNDCHRDKSSEWAAARVAEWYPDGRSNAPHYGQAIEAGRHWAADARSRLVELIDDEAQPDIARATGVRLLARQLAPADVDVLGRALDRDGALIQLAAIEAADELEPAQRIELAQRFLTHDLLALRIAAARVLVGARGELSARRQADLDAAIAEYLEVQAFNSDRPEGLLSAANVATERGELEQAEALYLRAIERYPFASALYVNLADLYRLMGRAGESEATLRAGLEQAPDAPGIHLSLAFALVRRGAPDEAMPYFRSAAGLAPDDPYYPYVLAIARNDAGEPQQALELLEATHERFPRHAGTLFALATMLRDAGEPGRALQYAERLAAQLPGDANALALLRALEQQL
jgi:tetratricopeptide (TPR) repeat protein